ncbi:myosin IC heavy chain-like [Ahaetulla prasina]|uniref:myosin IC heavy chain-like n=1 Tax=Ahaetulla prasina TaxID=499056 RepID=UPI002648F282|nr:myosin IC heavy chain-like [Ahaetulla prasina]
MSCKKEAEGGAALPCCQWEKLKASPGGGTQKGPGPSRGRGGSAAALRGSPPPGKRCASGAARRPGAAGGASSATGGEGRAAPPASPVWFLNARVVLHPPSGPQGSGLPRHRQLSPQGSDPCWPPCCD